MSGVAEDDREQRVNPNAPPDDDVQQGIIIYPEEERHVVLAPGPGSLVG